MRDTINLVLEKSNWGRAPKDVYQGFSFFFSHWTHAAEVAEVEMKDGFPVVKRVIVAVDCGIVVNPSGAKSQVEGAVIDGIGHAMYGDFTFKDGEPSGKNFDRYRMMRMQETPQVEVHFVQNGIAPSGLGEPGLPPAAAAVANAIKAATGKRLFKQPFINYFNKKEV